MVNYGRVARTVARKYPAVRKRYKVYYPALKQLGSDVMYLKGLINSEPHYKVVQTSNNFNWSGAVISLDTIGQSNGVSGRAGNRVLPRYLSMNLHINKQITSSTVDHLTVRFMIVRSWVDNGTGAGTLSPAEILDTVGNQYAPMSHLQADITGARGERNRRIEVLKSKLLTFDKVSFTSFSKKLNIEMNGGSKKEHTDYAESGSSEPNSGGIYAFFISDNTLSDASYYFESKLTYYDN